MMRLGKVFVSAVLLTLATGRQNLHAEATNEGPDFREVYDLIRQHAPDLSEAALNRAAVQGLISELSSRISLVTNSSSVVSPSNGILVSKAKVFDGPAAYLQIGRVDESLAQAISSAFVELNATNKLKGIVLDLRYSSGDNYGAAAKAADLFMSKQRPLLNWGDGIVQSKEKSDAINLPVAVLVNHQTARAAEALAAVLRDTGNGLILGSTTAGEAMLAQEFPLKHGERLRIATTPIQLGSGTALSTKGVRPDIIVPVSPDDERSYYADAFKVISRTGSVAVAGAPLTNQFASTNRTGRRPRFNEAELVRERREGTNLDAEGENAREREPEIPVVNDPALARALDLLKGLAVVRQSRS